MTTLVRRLLDERDLSDRALARGTGLSSSMVTQRMKGRTRWTFDDLFALADALGESPAFLVSELEMIARTRESESVQWETDHS